MHVANIYYGEQNGYLMKASCLLKRHINQVAVSKAAVCYVNRDDMVVISYFAYAKSSCLLHCKQCANSFQV